MLKKKIVLSLLAFAMLFGLFAVVSSVNAACSGVTAENAPVCTDINTDDLGFQIPTLGGILTFVIRAFFVIAGLVALFYMLLGALAWITSGGDKDGVTAAREKIQAAVIGVILIVVVLAIIWTLEQVIFKRRICLGLSCPVTLPGLIETTSGSEFCCICVNTTTGAYGDIADVFTQRCLDNGTAEDF